MNTTIFNNGLPKLPQTAASQGSSPAQGNVAASDTAGGAAKPADSVRLTDSARALQDAARTSDTAAIDTHRVEKIRQALANGSYQVNPARIADGMLALDSQIAGTQSVDKA